MKIEPTPFDRYVRMRLDAWGREFRLDRDFELLGHRSKDMLQVLIEHKGEMPARATGFRPLTIPPLEMQIEDVVHDIYSDTPPLAIVLRAYYCGSGRQGFERLEIARRLLKGVDRSTLSRRRYYLLHDLGFQRIAGALSALKCAA